MKPLPEQFEAKGFCHRQIARDGNVAIFERSKGKLKHFEVIRVQSHNGYEIAGNKYPPAEFYPRSEDWGTNGFTYTDFGAAYKRFQNLVKAR